MIAYHLYFRSFVHFVLIGLSTYQNQLFMILKSLQILVIICLMECIQLSELSQVKVRVNLKRIIDENGILKNEIAINSLHEVHFTVQLYANSRPLGATQNSNFFVPKNLFDQPIIFNCFYQDLPADSKIAISIWSTAKKFNINKPLGSTVIQLFDQRGELRQGKYHLFIWPDTLPDIEDPSSTPGLANDQNIETLNFISDKLQECDKSDDQKTFKAEEGLKFKLSYIYRLIPAAFLQVEFPKFGFPVFYNDKICAQFQSAGIVSKNLGQLGPFLQIFDYDYETEANDPLEDMYYTLKSQKQTSSQKLIPTKEQIKIMDLVASNTVKIEVKPSEKQLFYKYRHFLVFDKKYLSYFLNSISQQYSDEGQLQRLLAKWQKVDQADSLYFLSREFSLNPIYNRKKLPLPILKLIRDYAVSILAQLKDKEIIYNLLFLIQALRYEGQNTRSTLLDLLKQRSVANHQIASLVYWYLKTESDPIQGKQIKVTKQTEKNIKLYQSLFNILMIHIRQKSPQVMIILEKQINFFEVLKKIAKSVKQAKDKKAQLRKKLTQVDWLKFSGVPYPMDVQIILKEPIIEQCSVFSSKMVPIKLTFHTVGEQKFSFMFKSGDDLRQDQMVLQMFFLMDRLLKGVNQDYRLTPYKALACSRSDGYVEFVPETKTFQSIILKEYLTQLIQEKSPLVMENYVFSCAGYCAITYFFGIGDRHLQNLLIASSGKMLHIDFGFILGRDPKPYPPPIKIRMDMIEAMGGIQHDNFKIFKKKCLQAFLYLRKHSKIVYNLVHLMLDSGLKDVHSEGISKLYDKFAVQMNDTQAEKHFLLVLQQCKNAIAALVADKIHRWATHFR